MSQSINEAVLQFCNSIKKLYQDKDIIAEILADPEFQRDATSEEATENAKFLQDKLDLNIDLATLYMNANKVPETTEWRLKQIDEADSIRKDADKPRLNTGFAQRAVKSALFDPTTPAVKKSRLE